MFTVTSKHLVGIVCFFLVGLIGWSAKVVSDTEKEVLKMSTANESMVSSLKVMESRLEASEKERQLLRADMDKVRYECLTTTIKTISDLRAKMSNDISAIRKEIDANETGTLLAFPKRTVEGWSPTGSDPKIMEGKDSPWKDLDKVILPEKKK